jgi:hypothetical protein
MADNVHERIAEACEHIADTLEKLLSEVTQKKASALEQEKLEGE